VPYCVGVPFGICPIVGGSDVRKAETVLGCLIGQVHPVGSASQDRWLAENKTFTASNNVIASILAATPSLPRPRPRPLPHPPHHPHPPPPPISDARPTPSAPAIATHTANPLHHLCQHFRIHHHVQRCCCWCYGNEDFKLFREMINWGLKVDMRAGSGR
jgi:hypothetical protein